MPTFKMCVVSLKNLDLLLIKTEDLQALGLHLPWQVHGGWAAVPLTHSDLLPWLCFTSPLLDSGKDVWSPQKPGLYRDQTTCVFLFLSADRFSRGCLPSPLPRRNSQPTVPLRQEPHLTLHPLQLARPWPSTWPKVGWQAPSERSNTLKEQRLRQIRGKAEAKQATTAEAIMETEQCVLLSSSVWKWGK